MNNDFRRDLLYSLILGELASWFLIFVIKNPYIEEFKALLFLNLMVFFLPLIFPVVFLAGILFAKFLARFLNIIWQIAKFLEVGILNTLMDFGILNLLIWLTGFTGGFGIAPLNTFSFLCATSNSYFWNKFWTFGGEKKVSGKEFLQFLAVSIVGVGLNTGIVVAGTSLLLPWAGISAGGWANLMKFFATFAAMGWNFLGYKLIVFKYE
jgi:putative flippase GtrA